MAASWPARKWRAADGAGLGELDHTRDLSSLRRTLINPDRAGQSNEDASTGKRLRKRGRVTVMYIGLGTVVLIVIIVLVILMLRRR